MSIGDQQLDVSEAISSDCFEVCNMMIFEENYVFLCIFL